MLRITVSGASEALSILQRYDVRRLQNRLRTAIRNSLRAGKAELKSAVTQRYTAKNPMSLGSTKTKATALRGTLQVGGGRNPLNKFVLKPRSRPRKMPAGGVYANVVRGQGGMIRRGFLQRNGGVYERVGQSRYPIRRLTTVSLPGMASRVGERVIERMSRTLEPEIEAIM